MNEQAESARPRDVQGYIAREDQEGEEFLSTWLVAINCRNDNQARCTKGVVIDVGQTI